MGDFMLLLWKNQKPIILCNFGTYCLSTEAEQPQESH